MVLAVARHSPVVGVNNSVEPSVAHKHDRVGHWGVKLICDGGERMSDPGHRAELVDVIRQVRNRWRLKLALRGAVIVVGGTALALLLSASGLEALKFSAPAIIGFRIAIALVVVALLLRSVVEPLLRRVSDTQVALYLEEHDRTLETEILSAVEAVETASPDHSPALVNRLVQLAVETCRALEPQRAIDRPAMRRPLVTTRAVRAAGALP